MLHDQHAAFPPKLAELSCEILVHVGNKDSELGNQAPLSDRCSDLRCGGLSVANLDRDQAPATVAQDAKLQPLWSEAKSMLAGLRRWSATHVPRAQNSMADRLANEALDRVAEGGPARVARARRAG